MWVLLQDPCSGDSGGPLMWKNPRTNQFVIIGRYKSKIYFDIKICYLYQFLGTVQGHGYDCRQGKTNTFEGSDNGLWSKVGILQNYHLDQKKFGKK